MLRALGYAALIALGGVVALLGSAGHRSLNYVGVAIALATTLAGAVFARAWHAWVGFALFAFAWVAACVAIDQSRPGGSLLIVDDAMGRLWLYGGAAVLLLVAVVPRRVLEGRNVSE